MPNAVLLTRDTLVLNFGGTTKNVPVASPLFAQVKALLKSKASDADILLLLDPVGRLRKHASGLFSITEDGRAHIGGESLPASLSARLVAFADEGLAFEPLVKFWQNCQLNPDPVAKSDLYAFLEHNGHPITADGCFIAYRSCTDDFKARHPSPDGTHMDNSVGSVVTMDRKDCDADRDQTCSRGLHVAALGYVKGSYHDGHVLECKINPRDVVAIPKDYNGQKMRVCQFHVVAINKDGLIERPQYDAPVTPKEEKTLADVGGATLKDLKVDDEAGAVLSRAAVDADTSNDAWKTQPRKSNGQFARRK